jgi:hypothetical protein
LLLFPMAAADQQNNVEIGTKSFGSHPTGC